METEREPQRRTERAEQAIRHAKEMFFAMADDPDLCCRQILPILLAVVEPKRRAACERMFRENITDPQFRVEFAIWCYRGALDLYTSGELD